VAGLAVGLVATRYWQRPATKGQAVSQSPARPPPA
jgi:hypothetical protein